MKRTCKRIRDILAASGPAALRENEAAQEHLVECEECYALLEAMAELDQGLAALPTYDAPDEVVERLLASPELGHGTPPFAEEKPEAWWRRWQTAAANAAGWLAANRRRWVLVAAPVAGVLAVALLSVVTLQRGSFDALAPEGSVSRVSKAKDDQVVDGKTATLEAEEGEREALEDDEAFARRVAGLDVEEKKVAEKRREERLRRLQSLGYVTGGAPADRPTSSTEAGAGVGHAEGAALSTAMPTSPAGKEVAQEEAQEYRSKTDASRRQAEFGDETRPQEENEALRDELDKAGEQGLVLGYPDGTRSTAKPQTASTVSSEQEAERFRSQANALRQQLEVMEKIEGADDEVRVLREQLTGFESALNELDTTTATANAAPEPQAEPGAYEDLDKVAELEFSKLVESAYSGRQDADGSRKNEPAGVGGMKRPAPALPTTDGSIARAFLAERASLENLVLQEARGYWANTYVPGDWQLRRLHARLTAMDRSGLEALVNAPLTLHDGSDQGAQPFDPPDNAALAVYLHADRKGLATRGRIVVQVGLQATPRHSGRRGAMNLAAVLDLRGEVTVETAATMRVLVEALAQARDHGDRFSLVVAGRPGGVVLPPGDFRHGPITVAMGRLFGDDRADGAGLGLEQAVVQAMDLVAETDDPTAPIGSSAVLLVTSQSVGAAADRLAALAHQRAVEGVPLSVVGIGSGVRVDEIDRLVLAGQGNRRLVTAPAAAAAAIDRELAAVGRVVARAVRLRIRLAPGVQLVDVLGSRRLDEARAQQVRDAENSIDQRLSRNLGIVADRGLDEEGIQVVIPSFYAADAHVILLDVVAPGPGPVADVSVRFKDLVGMRNGVARAHLSLSRDEGEPGPLELNVLVNLLGRRLGETLERAGAALAGGDREQAIALLTRFRTLLAELPGVLPGLAGSPALAADAAMLDQYLALLAAGADADATVRGQLVDSLRYAGRLKVLPRPE